MNETAHRLITAAMALLILAPNAPGQAADPAPAAADTTAGPKWSFGASAYGYFIPDDRKYVQPSFWADRERLHLEARYNYEDKETGSVWAGANFSAGDKLKLDVTPMIGGVFGNTAGIAPAYKLTLGYRKVEFYSEGEYVFDLRNRAGNFFYAWSELSYSPVDWMRAGIAGQRTRAYETDLDIQRGFLVGFSRRKIDFTAYILNLGWTDPTVILSIAVEF